MALIKLGEAFTITASDIQSSDVIANSPEVTEHFAKIAQELKIIAPKANDFLYFHAVMMHAAEASALNDDGSLKSLASGEPVKVWWEKKGDSWKWNSTDPSLKPYRNANLDIFPEEELLKAHKKWVGKPLCLDHKSSSVEMVRGCILDTYYDYKLKRVVALCALDKKNYPELARQVSTGYATSVSMGTGVERAICTDCGTVAKAEPEFCNHMKYRTCYGEINVGLNPIELSIVVNGADPKAKIKHVVAAANSLAQYVAMKEEQFSDKDLSKEQNLQDWRKAYATASEIKQEISKLEVEAKESSDLSDALNKISSTLIEIQKQINKLSHKDSEMSQKQAYFQGGGGVNEPTPGQSKYPKEEADKIRDTQDKQMTGQMDTGPVDGMHPGYESFGESETERKRRLQRLAEEEIRSLRRQAALEKAKEAYWQGGGGENEPTPGKAKYPKEDAEKIRNKEDKQMQVKDVGKQDGLFPGDEDKKKMLSRAEKLNAKFVKAAKADGSDDLDNSRWDIYADSKLVLSASVKELTGDRSELLYDKVATRDFGKTLLSKVLSNGVEKVASLVKGAQAAPAPAAPAPAPAPAAAPAPAMGTGLMPGGEFDLAPGGDKMDMAKDEGGTGDPSEKLPELLDEAENVLSDIRQGVEALSGDSGKELEPVQEMAESGMASPALASLVTMQKKLGKVLLAGMKEEAEKLEMSIDEIKVARKALAVNRKTASVRKLASETVSTSQDLISKAYQLMDAFNKYAMGTEILIEKSKKEMKKSAQFAGHELDPLGTDKKLEEGASAVAPKRPLPFPSKPKAPAKPAPKSPSQMSDKEHAERRFGPGATGTEGVDLAGIPTMVGERAMSDSSKGGRHGGTAILPGGAPKGTTAPMGSDKYHEELKKMYGKDSAKADDMNDVKMNPDGSVEGTKDEVAAVAKELSSKASLATPEGRAAWRAKVLEKIAKETDSVSKMLQDAHKGGGTTLKLDMKPTGDLAKVETLEETHKAMKDLAMAPPKVKKAAEDIQKLVTSGKIAASKVDELVKAGLDKDAVAYWKAFYGQGKDSASKEFVSELTAEHAKAKMAAELDKERVKLARAYELSNEMARKGLIPSERHAVSQQVNELLSFNDEAFSSMQRYVDRVPAVTKQAFTVPQVGLIGEEVITKQASDSSKNLVEELTLAFNTAKKHF